MGREGFDRHKFIFPCVWLSSHPGHGIRWCTGVSCKIIGCNGHQIWQTPVEVWKFGGSVAECNVSQGLVDTHVPALSKATESHGGKWKEPSSVSLQPWASPSFLRWGHPLPVLLLVVGSGPSPCPVEWHASCGSPRHVSLRS